MQRGERIPVVVKSGNKFETEHGFSAIKNGVKERKGSHPEPIGRKPGWLKVKLPTGGKYQDMKSNVRTNRLATVCEESMCPNIGECWSAGTATIMLMGAVCTRACKFCAVDTGNPKGWLDKDEPQNAADSVAATGLKYIVLTSVDRDDLDDGGAQHYADCVKAIIKASPAVNVETLTPDFKGNLAHLEIVLDSGIKVFAQNLETVKRLTHPVRDPRASYETTMDLLAHSKKYRPDILTKTSLMLGLGETDEEIMETMEDLRKINLDIVTFGQYLRPTPNHLPVERYVSPADFDKYRQWGLELGFKEVVSGPFVRSSYRAERALEGNNAGIKNVD
ncbi:lipoyl synthase [Aliikangiella coralliicola]|uniref:Lipoyl synthase n=1 Tax=Aliikangiella coralliicola TaxID=2592383 RepID=A0A545U7J6_9GAMM|nr:lipoyl synthase [Aliikangiella coralliicola]TQV85438.1 lipoyl synthase [Aliikangiella coralliicola]